MGIAMQIPILPCRNQADSPRNDVEGQSHPKENTLEEVTRDSAYLTSC